MLLWQNYSQRCGGSCQGPYVPGSDVHWYRNPIQVQHLYNKIKYGSFFQEPRGYMPAFGAQTSVQDRWDMVNYMMSDKAFRKEVVQ